MLAVPICEILSLAITSIAIWIRITDAEHGYEEFEEETRHYAVAMLNIHRRATSESDWWRLRGTLSIFLCIVHEHAPNALIMCSQRMPKTNKTNQMPKDTENHSENTVSAHICLDAFGVGFSIRH